MKLKENKGISLTGFVITILVILLVIAWTGCVYLYHNPRIQTENQQSSNQLDEKTTEKNAINETVKPEETKKEIKKINDEKELIYTYASKIEKEYSFEIPFVNINSVYAKEINKEIQERYPNLEELAKNAIEYPADEFSRVEYESYINNNILSLVVIEGIEPREHYVYNIDIYTGKKVSNYDILKVKNISESKFLDRVEELCKTEFEKLYGNAYEYYKERKEERIKDSIDKTKKMTVEMFLDQNNNINIIGIMAIDIEASEVEIIINTKL